jgi:tRNA A-37 threonylcarbamoyl transferase component Bud32
MTDLVGQTIAGRYRVDEFLGRGGMATVYKAYQASMDRYVALKVLPRQFMHDPSFLGRFEREAHTIAKLEHAYILPVYDYGQHEGVPYLAMRYVEGGTLADLLKEHPRGLPLDEAARLIEQVASALDCAHQAGIIHRDVKPSNVLLDKTGNTLLTDFGIAKIAEATVQFTGGGTVGTPAYMSPEQGMGKKELTPATDVYSLGIVLYEMLTGRVPFEAETPIAIITSHVYDPPPPPRNLRADLPEAVEGVLLRALAKAPEDRYPTGGEMAAALSEAIHAPSAPRPARPVAPLEPTYVATVEAPSPTPPAAPTPVQHMPEVPSVPARSARPARPARREPRRGGFLNLGTFGMIGIAAVLACVLGVGLGLILLSMGYGRPAVPTLPPLTIATMGGASPSPVPPVVAVTSTPVIGAGQPQPTAEPPQPTDTPRPSDTPKPTETPSGEVCEDAPPTRLKVGDHARVTFTDGRPLRIRSSPDATTTDNVTTQIPEGTEMDILTGPECGDNFVWWRIRTVNGVTGWVAEGDFEDYYVEPWD